jgi:hypothetical protein
MQLYSVKTKYKSEHVLLALKYLKVIGIHEHTYRQTLDPHESSITVQHMQYNTIQFDLIKSHDTKHIKVKLFHCCCTYTTGWPQNVTVCRPPYRHRKQTKRLTSYQQDTHMCKLNSQALQTKH